MELKNIGEEKFPRLYFLILMPERAKRPTRATTWLPDGHELPPPAGIAFGEVACARRAITNKFALYSLARNFVLFEKRELAKFKNIPALYFFIEFKNLS